MKRWVFLILLSHAALFYYTRYLNPIIPPHMEFAVVNRGEIFQKSKVYKTYIGHIESESKKAQAQNLEFEKILRPLDQEINLLKDQKKNSKLLQEKQKIFNEKYKEAEQFTYKTKERIQRYAEQIGLQLEKNMQTALAKIVKKRQISIVFTSDIAGQAIILHSEKYLDITNDLLKELDAMPLNIEG